MNQARNRIFAAREGARRLERGLRTLQREMADDPKSFALMAAPWKAQLRRLRRQIHRAEARPRAA